ncbi:MAG: hypothetical protein H6719_28400 [Sandaracinaceae bacterium]|nr:hypothetical protein [Sandaracinaceae bacterium]
MNDASCRHVTLARGSAAAISFCPECNALAIHMGAVTLRLPPAGAEALWATLGEALHALPVHVDARARGPVGHA